jgi:hypothetical protein
MRLATPVILLSCALIVVGCLLGDAGVHFYAINDSPQPLIVKFSLDGASPYAAYVLPANDSGDTLQTLGPTTWTGTVLILDPGCRPMWKSTINGGTGGVLISSDGSISWTSVGPRWPREEEPPGPLSSTTTCDVPASS